MEEAQSYSVGELAAATGISVRTLHHYDSIGLLSPTSRSAAGYRQYDADDATRLFRILIYRELGFDLTRIGEILDDPAADATVHLEHQRTLLQQRIDTMQRMLNGVEAVMRAKKNGYNLTPAEMKEVFGDFDPAEHAAEAESRWGDTDAYRESSRRVKSYGKSEWEQIRAEADGLNAAFIHLMQSGTPADSDRARALAEEHRQHISRWFYDCTPDIHRGLADMYVGDPRFAQHYENQAAGLSTYISTAIKAAAISH